MKFSRTSFRVPWQEGILATAILLLLFSSCRSTSVYRATSAIERFADTSEVFNQYFLGYMFYDPEKEMILAAQNEEKYFTPASVTKLFTFYTALQLIGDSIPGLKYSVSGDTLWFSGTGDPAFLHPDLQDTTGFDFLKSWPGELYYVPAVFEDEHYGPGWAWDDYNYYFMAEKSPFPIYGNVLRFEFREAYPPEYELKPAVFASFVQEDTLSFPKNYLKRDLWNNTFRYNPDRAPRWERTTDVPFVTSDSLFLRLLSDTLRREVQLWEKERLFDFEVFNSLPADTVYKRLLTESDNFIAEQLLLMCSGLVNDTLSVPAAIDFSKEFLLSDLKDELIWVDGSGLSRYNMFTPRSMVEVLKKIYAEMPEERIFALLPTGGQSGTLKYWYGGDTPFVHAKTGTVRHNHNLAGLLKAKSGKTILFVIMNNHIPGPSSMAKKEMEKLLREVYERY
jgi:serine-type D-Ala-D-Ala carboxypeptidase/endopeptidase (penicillin-binding protein 4)